ncbi:MAG TPA: type II toxin-antitoxin system RelE/ParE family toxin [Vicinamibacteria bacterium]|nr:type II toxin-antitoxin system RelE/ParE family toxin [Vicinamibacteria bacterium]
MEWAQDARGQEPAFTFFEGQEAPDQAKILALFQMLAETGRIPNREKFKSLGERGLGLFEFKSFQLRFIGDFRPGKRFLVAHGLRKKKDELDRVDIETAARILKENDQREAKERRL